METLRVNLADRSYEILIGAGLLSEAGKLIAECVYGRRALIVSNPRIAALHASPLRDSLQAAGFQTETALVPMGERYKTLASIRKLYAAMLAHRMDRKSVVIALGGGVIGDMAGFAAATFLRGIDFVQVPTTLLAQVDASVGGKVGVDLPEGKNLVGAFHQPRAVLVDISTLRTLPRRELRSGAAEMIKHGLIRDVDFLGFLEQNLSRIQAIDEGPMIQAVRRNCEIKAAVVEDDERESGLRALLNYGHTLGHAIETVTGYRRYRHGEGVSLGMIAAAGIAFRRGLISRDLVDRQRGILKAAGLPVQLDPSVSIPEILAATKLDKKVEAGKVRFVLLTGPGEASVFDDVDPALVRTAVEEELRAARAN